MIWLVLADFSMQYTSLLILIHALVALHHLIRFWQRTLLSYYVDSDTMYIDKSISDNDVTYITIRSGYSNSNCFKRLILDYKIGDYIM
jgi:hypothetical protein